jgi:hypothetical protein
MLAFGSPAKTQVAVFGPALPSERQTTESSRSVAARDYRDAYCAKWTDGCVVCQRTTAGEEPSCEAVANTQACSQRPVRCEAVLRTINRVCLHIYGWVQYLQHTLHGHGVRGNGSLRSAFRVDHPSREREHDLGFRVARTLAS